MFSKVKLWIVLLMATWVTDAAAASSATSQGDTCKNAIRRGQRATAIAACKEALRVRSAPEQMTDVVQALLLGEAPLTPEELYEAAVMSRSASRWGDLWGAMTRCHLGKRLGDEHMLTTCTKTLTEKYAHLPQVSALLQDLKPRKPWGFLVSWGVMLACLAGTAAHALLRWLKSHTKATAVAAVAAILLASLVPSLARAQQGTPIDIDLPNRFPIDDANPRASVPTPEQREKFPLDFGYFLQESLDRAERATAEKRHADAAKYYYAVAAAVPDVAIGFTKLCDSLEKAGQIKEAILACKGAVAREGAKVADHVNLVRLIFSQPDPLETKQLEDVAATVAHLKAEAEKKNLVDTRIVALDLECDLAKRTHDNGLLAKCTEELAKLSPGTARTISLQWAVAMLNNDKPAAERLAALAAEKNLSAEVVSKMKEGAQSLKPAWRRAFSDWRILLTAVFVVFAAGLVALRKRTWFRQRMA